MTRQNLRAGIGTSMVGFHFLLIVLVIVMPGIGISKSFQLLTIVAPLFAGFSTVIIKYYISPPPPPQDADTAVPLPLVIFSFLIPACLFFVTLYLIIGFAKAWIAIDFDNLKYSLGALETLFGVYIGYIVDGLFRSHSKSKKAKKA